jgi:WD40 repeat protein
MRALLIALCSVGPAATADLPLTGQPAIQRPATRLGTSDQRGPYFRLSWADSGRTIFGGDADAAGWRTWDAATGTLKDGRSLPPDVRGLNEVRWTGGGRLFGWQRTRKMAVADRATLVRFVEFDALDGKVAREWVIDRGELGLGFTFSSVTLSPDRKTIVGHENDMDIGGDLHVLDWEKRRHVRRIDLRSNAWSDPQFHFTPDGTAFVMTERHQDSGSRCFEAATGIERWSLLNGAVKAAAFTRDGELWLIGAGRDRPWVAACYDAATGRARPVPAGFAVVGEPHDLAVTPDDRRLVLSGSKGTLVWDRQDRKPTHLLPATTADLLVSPDGRSVVTNNGLFQRWDLDAGKPLFEDTASRGHADEVLTLAFGPDSKRLYSAAADGTVRIWDVTSAKPIRTFALGERRFPDLRNARPMKGHFLFAVAEEIGRMATLGYETPVQLWDLGTGQEVGRVELPARTGPRQVRAPWAVTIAPDGKQVRVAVLDHEYGHQSSGRPSLLEWEPAAGRHRFARLPIKGVWPNEDRISPDLRYALDGYNGLLYDLRDGKGAGSLERSRSLGLGFSPDGKLLAVAETVQRAQQLGEPEQAGVALVAVPGSKAAVRFALEAGQYPRRVAFDPRHAGQVVVVVTGSELQLRDTAGHLIWRGDAGGRAGEPVSVEVSPTGMLATGHRDGTILLWQLPATGAGDRR